jgi:hypothetical protein
MGVDMDKREQRQANFVHLFEDTLSELQQEPPDPTKIDTLKTGDEAALGTLASQYGLSRPDLVAACDALLALPRVWEQTIFAGRWH